MLSNRKKQYGIIFDKVVKEALDKEAREMGCSTSWLINYICKAHLKGKEKASFKEL